MFPSYFIAQNIKKVGYSRFAINLLINEMIVKNRINKIKVLARHFKKKLALKKSASTW